MKLVEFDEMHARDNSCGLVAESTNHTVVGTIFYFKWDLLRNL